MVKYSQLHKTDIQEITSNYELTVIDFESIEGGSGNSNYLLHTEQGKFVLTVMEIDLARAICLVKLLLYLEDYDFPATRLYPLVKGSLTTIYLGKPIIIKPFIFGQVWKDLDAPMLEQAGMAMAKLHHIPAPDFLPEVHDYGLEAFSKAIGRNIDPEFESWLAERHAALERNISPGLPRGLIHGDLFYDNIIFEDQSIKAFIDFEEACRYYKVFDLGMGVLGLCVEDTEVNLTKARALVFGYQKIRSLAEQENECLQLFTEYAAIATSYWWFWKFNIHTPIAEKADKHWKMAAIARNVNAIPKARFMEAVFN